MGSSSLCITRGAWDHPLREMSGLVHNEVSRSRHAAYGLAPAPHILPQTNEHQAKETEDTQ